MKHHDAHPRTPYAVYFRQLVEALVVMAVLAAIVVASLYYTDNLAMLPEGVASLLTTEEPTKGGGGGTVDGGDDTTSDIPMQLFYMGIPFLLLLIVTVVYKFRAARASVEVYKARMQYARAKKKGGMSKGDKKIIEARVKALAGLRRGDTANPRAVLGYKAYKLEKLLVLCAPAWVMSVIAAILFASGADTMGNVFIAMMVMSIFAGFAIQFGKKTFKKWTEEYLDDGNRVTRGMKSLFLARPDGLKEWHDQYGKYYDNSYSAQLLHAMNGHKIVLSGDERMTYQSGKVE